MAQINKRLFVGNLPPAMVEHNLKNFFSTFGKVKDVELKSKSDPSGQQKQFAYVNINLSDRGLAECLEKSNKTCLEGHTLEVQVAKESFLQKLERERSGGADNPIDKTIKPSIYGGRAKREWPSTGTSNASSTKTTGPQAKSVDRPKREWPSSKSSTSVNTLPLIRSTIKPAVNSELINESNEPIKDKKEADNERRLNSLYNQQDRKKSQSELIKSALNSDKPINKKIVFDADDGQPRSVLPKKSLFEGDEEGFGGDFELDLSSKVDRGTLGRKSEKIIELQSRFAHDSRFKIDDKFVDSDGEEGVHEDGPDNFEAEKNKNLDILESVIGRSIMRKDRTVDGHFRDLHVQRFNPDDHEMAEKFEVKRNVDDTSTAAKKRPKLVQPNPEPETSKERFYEVKSNLKEAFSAGASSSFQLFGGREVEEEAPGQGDAYKNEKLPKNDFKNQRNPFKYDSSDTEDEGTESRPKSSKETLKNAKATNSFFDQEKFFFEEGDKRLLEDDFFNPEIIARHKRTWKQTAQVMIEVMARRRRHSRRKKQFAEKIELSTRRLARNAKGFKKGDRKKWDKKKSGHGKMRVEKKT